MSGLGDSRVAPLGSRAPIRVVIAGGGTAGHVLPGLAIAEELVDRGLAADRCSVLMVGSKRGIESDLVPPAGFGLHLLPGRGIQRRLTLVNLLTGVSLLVAATRAFFLLLRRRPDAVVVLGGYASVPCGLAAVLLRIPIMVAEQNAIPGAANRLLGRFARACAISFEGTSLPRAVVTGNPVRPAVRRAGMDNGFRLEARQNLGIGDRPFVVVFGGSLGSRQINRATTAAVENWTGGPVVLQHVVGQRGWSVGLGERARSAPPAVDYRPVEYEKDMPTVLSAADLVICRAGATTVAELSVLAVPAVLVHLPGAPDDHQTANASRLAAAGAALLVADDDLEEVLLSGLLSDLVADFSTLKTMSEASRHLGRPDAARRVVDLLLDVLADRGKPLPVSIEDRRPVRGAS